MSHFATPLSRDMASDDSSSGGQTPSAPPSSSKRGTTTPAPENSKRKPRGRPPGSKNKPKPPVFITKEPDHSPSLKPAILEIASGSDIIHSVIKFAAKNHVGVTVLSATGTVSNVTLRHPNAHAPSLSLHGPFNLLALSGSFIGPSSCCSFGISLAGAQGQVFGGIVAGKVVAASQVVVVAATFMNPTVHRVTRGEEAEEGEEEMSNVDQSMSVYGSNVANPTPVNCQVSPEVVHWQPHHY